MAVFLETVALGLVSGVLSGTFGIGGGVLTTPAIRLLLGAPAFVAVGTPLVAIIPATVTGAASYVRKGIADPRSGLILGLAGSVTAALGAWVTRLVGGTVVLVATAAVILYVALDMVLQIVRPPRPGLEAGEERDAFAPEPPIETGAAFSDGVPPAAENTPGPGRPRRAALIGIGAVTGFYSGFLGLGGGFILVPMLTRWLRVPIKRAIGTSLVAIGVLAVPGCITHALLGNIDWRIAAGLTLGVIPGAMVGARITFGANERVLRIAFALLFGLAGVWLGLSELLGWAA